MVQVIPDPETLPPEALPPGEKIDLSAPPVRNLSITHRNGYDVTEHQFSIPKPQSPATAEVALR